MYPAAERYRLNADCVAAPGTSSTHIGGPDGGGSKRGQDAGSSGSQGIANENVEPFPSRLLTWISPPMAFTSRLQMLNPRPVPPNRRVVVWSACENGEKMVTSLSSGMPMPLSWTLTSIFRRSCDA